MDLTCPYCRHAVSVSDDAESPRVKCGNCGALVTIEAPQVPLATPAADPAPPPAPIATATEPPIEQQDGLAITALVFSLIFCVPVVTQALGLVLGIIALVRRPVGKGRPATAWVAIALSFLFGIGWSVLLVNFSAWTTIATPGVSPYAGNPYSETGGAPGAIGGHEIESALERVGQALAAYQRDMGRWPGALDDLVPTYLSVQVVDSLDPDRAATENRQVTFLADVDSPGDPADRMVAYSISFKRDSYGEVLKEPQRWVLRKNGVVEAIGETAFEALLSEARGEPGS